MKKTLLIIICAVFISMNIAVAQQIANGGFENWYNDTLCEDPDVWSTANMMAVFEDVDTILVTKSSDSHSGNYSVKLETIVYDGDTVFSWIMIGNPEESDFTGGTPFTTAVDTLRGWYKYDIQTGDTAIILVVLKNAGVTFSSDTIWFTGTQSTWTEFAYGVNIGLGTPDSLIIAFASSLPFNGGGIPGSWMMVDSIYFTAPAGPVDDIPNHDFEDWSYTMSEEPEDWATMNTMVAFFGESIVTKNETPYTGNYAAELKTIYFDMWGDTVNGFITNGWLGENGPDGGVPYTWQPDSIQAYYKYFPVGTDTARIGVIFSNSGIVIYQGWVQFTDSVDTYTQFSIPLSVPSVPDTMMIMAWAGDNPGSVLIIDDLVFDFVTGTNDIEHDFISVKTYPNPASNMVFVSYNLTEKADVAISVYDIQGRKVLKKVVKSQNSGKHLMKLDVNNLSPGLYIYQLTIGDKIITNKLSIE